MAPLDCVWLAEPDVPDEADGFAEDEPDWPDEADGFAEDEPDWPDEADWFAEDEPDWPDMPDEADWAPEPLAEATEFRPGMSAFACFAWSIAACVRGPMMPSIGPGSKPLSLRACWSCFTCSSPCAPLAEAEAPLVPEAEAPLALAPSPAAEPWPAVELPAEPDAMPDDGLAEDEAEGWLVDEEADWLDAGWLAEADFDESDWPAAIAVPAAVSAAMRASFVNFMVGILYGQLTAIHFVGRKARKFRGRSAPSDARRLAVPHGGGAT